MVIVLWIVIVILGLVALFYRSKAKCKHCSNPPYKDSEYCYPHMVAEERANE